MRRKVSIARARRFARLVQQGVCLALRENIALQESAKGEPFKRLWVDAVAFPNGEVSDRSGMPTLIDSGALVASIRPGAITRVGNQLVCQIMAKDYGLKQHRGFVSDPPNIVGRTLAIRKQLRSGGFGEGMGGETISFRRTTYVPARPWITILPHVAANEARKAAKASRQ